MLISCMPQKIILARKARALTIWKWAEKVFHRRIVLVATVTLEVFIGGKTSTTKAALAGTYVVFFMGTICGSLSVLMVLCEMEGENGL